MQHNQELLGLLVTNDAGAYLFLLILFRLHMIIRASRADGVFSFSFFFLVALHWNTCMCIQDITSFILALLIWNLPDFYPGLDKWLPVGYEQTVCHGFVFGFESAFQPLAPGPPAAYACLWGLQKVSSKNKASVRIFKYDPVLCTFFRNFVGFCQANQVDHYRLWLLL